MTYEIHTPIFCWSYNIILYFRYGFSQKSRVELIEICMQWTDTHKLLIRCFLYIGYYKISNFMIFNMANKYTFLVSQDEEFLDVVVIVITITTHTTLLFRTYFFYIT